MKFSDAELQSLTGYPIVIGHLSIGSSSDMRALGIPKHQRVLLAYPHGHGRGGWMIWPITDATPRETGFYDAAVGTVGLVFDSLSQATIDELVDFEGQRLLRGGADAGALIHRQPSGPSYTAVYRGRIRIHGYQLDARLDTAGLQLMVSGRFVSDVTDSEPNLLGKDFSVEATIPWEILTIKGFKCSTRYWKFATAPASGAATSAPSVVPHAHKLSDLLIDEALNWPIFRGRFAYTPEAACSALRAYDKTDGKFLFVHFDDQPTQGLRFSNASSVVVYDNGFARAGAIGRSLMLSLFGRSVLEEHFARHDALSLQLAGDHLGWTQYNPYAQVSPGSIRQDIETLSFDARLGKEGLALSATGKLADFDATEVESHRKERNSKLKPLRGYAIEAMIPWALLIARGFSFAHRVRKF